MQKFQPYRNNQKVLIHPHLSKIRHCPRRQNVDYFGCKCNNTDLTQAFITTPCAFLIIITQLRMSCCNIGLQSILHSCGSIFVVCPHIWHICYLVITSMNFAHILARFTAIEFVDQRTILKTLDII